MHVKGAHYLDLEIVDVILFDPHARGLEKAIRLDWQRVHDLVKNDQKHLVHGAMGTYLQPRTKSSWRGFALVKSLTWTMYAQKNGLIGDGESLVKNGTVKAKTSAQTDVLARFAPYVGQNVGKVAAEVKDPTNPAAKQYVADIVRRIFGARNYRAEILEFEEMGLSIKSLRLREDGFPHFPVSFPTFDQMEIGSQTWEKSEFSTQVDYIFFVPIILATGAISRGPIPESRLLSTHKDGLARNRTGMDSLSGPDQERRNERAPDGIANTLHPRETSRDEGGSRSCPRSQGNGAPQVLLVEQALRG